MKVGKCQAKGEKAKNKKKNSIFLKEGRLSAQPRGKKQKTKTTNNNKKREKVDLNNHVQ